MNQVKRIACALLALLMVLSVSTAAFASNNADFNLTARYENGQNIVEVSLAGSNVTNGLVEVRYDHTQVTLLAVTPGDSSWIVSIDALTPGLVSFGWVGSHIYDETTVVTLVFGTAGGSSFVSYTASLLEIYSSGVRQEPTTSPIAIATVTAPGGSGSGSGSGYAPVHPFTDIAGHWAEQDIIAAYQMGLFNGTGSGTTFSPNMILTRGMLVTLLHRMAGQPVTDGSHPFTDVADGMYYSAAVAWAYQNNVVAGTGDGTAFSPDMAVTREQMVTMLYRYAELMHLYTGSSATLDPFTDSESVSGWAEAAMKWAVAEGIIAGTPAGTLLPQGTTDRAQAATVLVRFLG